MLIKILFTLAVIIVVVLVFRNKRDTKASRSPNQSHGQSHGQSLGQSPMQSQGQASASGSLSTHIVAYIILGILIVISVSVFVINYQSDNQIITIKVIAGDGMSTVYQAKQKSIKGRHFVTLDGKQVALGDGDRIEIDRVEVTP